jgi:hypothetical protein
MLDMLIIVGTSVSDILIVLTGVKGSDISAHPELR